MQTREPAGLFRERPVFFAPAVAGEAVAGWQIWNSQLKQGAGDYEIVLAEPRFQEATRVYF